jgi:capsular exopolysaccharide synthesis family protein
MSQIFDAIHRSEADRCGADLAGVTTAPELLESAERQLRLGESRSSRDSVAEVDLSHPFPSATLRISPDSKLVCATDRESLAAEKFRFLGVRLRHLQQTRHITRLVVTSSSPEEGKSTIAANLAISLASREQQKVLLLDGDLRRPTQGKYLGLSNRPGLSELLQGATPSAMNIYRLDSLGIAVLPAGAPPDEPLTLMQSGRLALLIDQLSARFSWIVIDSPPVLPLGDTSVWMRLSDAILLVTRPGTTQKRELERTLGAIEQSKLLGALINGSAEAASSSYYYYHRSGRSPVSPAAGHPQS